MSNALPKVEEFREKVAQLSREELLDLIKQQDEDQGTELIKHINRIEWVFANKMDHLTWSNGEPITERLVTNEELSLILDPPFIEDPTFAEMGMTRQQQYNLHIASDPVLWAKEYLGAKPRAHQILVLREPHNRVVLRWGRRLGKTWSLSVKLLHYAYTNPKARCLVMAPMKAMVALIFEEINNLAEDTDVENSIFRAVASPQHEIDFTNGSTIRLFTTGMRSGGKSDVARGQEAHLIVLDEMDYMGIDDLDALYAMLQQTDENQPEKQLVGASTPTGRRERFWDWNHSDRFRALYFPSYVNPFWNKEMEEEFHEQYSEMGFRHEVEADWGEDAEGVYPKRYLDRTCKSYDWPYIDARTSVRSQFIIGVDWDKIGAGPNICVLEVCGMDYEKEEFAGKLRIAYREEIDKGEYALTTAVKRIIELNQKFNPIHIYVDRGYGDSQVELLQQHGLENPSSNMKKKLRGVSFSESIEVRDPATKELVKKKLKPFMVENLRFLMERDMIYIPERDDDIYEQLLAYVVVRVTAEGRPVFEASGSKGDHAHDALILACLAYTENFDTLFKTRYATKAKSFSNTVLLPEGTVDKAKEVIKEEYSDKEDSGETREAQREALRKARARRRKGPRSRRGTTGAPISRKVF